MRNYKRKWITGKPVGWSKEIIGWKGSEANQLRQHQRISDEMGDRLNKAYNEFNALQENCKSWGTITLTRKKALIMSNCTNLISSLQKILTRPGKSKLGVGREPAAEADSFGLQKINFAKLIFSECSSRRKLLFWKNWTTIYNRYQNIIKN